MATHSMNSEEYWDKVDPDVTGDPEGGPLQGTPNVGDLGPDNVEKAREELNDWNEKNDGKPSHQQ